jgi:hypothetical protein
MTIQTLCDIKCDSDLRQIGGVIPGTLVSSTNKTDCHDITEILLKVVLNTMTLTLMTTYKFVIREIILIEFVSCNCFHSVRMSQYIAENVDLLNFMIAIFVCDGRRTPSDGKSSYCLCEKKS